MREVSAFNLRLKLGPVMGNACAPGAAGPRARKLVKTAVTGHSGWSTNSGWQIFKTRSLVWFGLLNLACTVTERWSPETWKQSRISCLSGCNPPLSVPKRFDFRNSPWNITMQAAQNTQSIVLENSASLWFGATVQASWEFPDNFSSFNLLNSLNSGL